MKAYQSTFIELCLKHHVLQFGQFTLKSGRISPYFFNAGLFYTGTAIATLGECYAKALLEEDFAFDMLFGPAYKGIPLVSSTAIALAVSGHDISYCFNRKEAKDHGEGGALVGAPLEGRIVIVDDVITAGTAIRTVLPILKSKLSTVTGILLALDRQERGKGEQSAVSELQNELKVPVKSIINLDCLIQYLKHHPDLASQVAAMDDYRSRYGVSS